MHRTVRAINMPKQLYCTRILRKISLYERRRYFLNCTEAFGTRDLKHAELAELATVVDVSRRLASVDKVIYVPAGMKGQPSCDTVAKSNRNDEVVNLTTSHGKHRFIIIYQLLQLDFKRRRRLLALIGGRFILANLPRRRRMLSDRRAGPTPIFRYTQHFPSQDLIHWS